MDKSLNTLTPLSDFVARIENQGSVPTLAAFETVNTSGCWALIKDRFARTHTDASEFPHFLPPLPLVVVPDLHKALLHGILEPGASNIELSLVLEGASGNSSNVRLRDME